MNTEVDSKIETIIISCVNRLYEKESSCGLDFEDLKCLDIIFKISKDTKSQTSTSPILASSRPENLVELLRAVKGMSSDDSSQ